MNVEFIIESLMQAMPTEQLQQIKSAMKKVDEFLPLIEGYHSTIQLKPENFSTSFSLA